MDNAFKESNLHSRKQSIPKAWAPKDGFTEETQKALMQAQTQKETPVKKKSLNDINYINRP